MSDSPLIAIKRWAILGDFNPTSPKQVLNYLRAKGYKIPKHRTTKKETSNDEGLEVLMRQHPKDEVLPLILEARHLLKAQSYLSDNIIGRDDRIHPRYTFIPKTGRLSSKAPNVMNFPQGRKGELMKEVALKIRESILPSEGYKLGEFDWNAIEALLTGFSADDQDYMDAAVAGVHDIFASHILYKRGIIPKPFKASDPGFKAFKKWLVENHDSVRAMAKKRIYAGSYGQGVYNMARDLQCSVAEVRELDTIFESMAPKVIKWQKDTKLRAHSEGQLTNPFGYRMSFFEVFKTDGSDGREANEALAFFPQSTCAAMLREVLVDLGQDPREGKKFNLLIPTHDSILFEFPEKHEEEVMGFIRSSMERAWKELNGLVIRTEGKVGTSGATMKKVT